jgi:hypothetical protein
LGLARPKLHIGLGRRLDFAISRLLAGVVGIGLAEGVSLSGFRTHTDVILSREVPVKTLRMLAGGLALMAFALASPALAQAPAPRVLGPGDKAPDFTLLSDDWKEVKLSDFRGKKNVVLVFYVLAFTET